MNLFKDEAKETAESRAELQVEKEAFAAEVRQLYGVEGQLKNTLQGYELQVSGRNGSGAFSPVTQDGEAFLCFECRYQKPKNHRAKLFAPRNILSSVVVSALYELAVTERPSYQNQYEVKPNLWWIEELSAEMGGWFIFGESDRSIVVQLVSGRPMVTSNVKRMHLTLQEAQNFQFALNATIADSIIMNAGIGGEGRR